ncbi:MAG: metalloregulator ArsR/SmtB family transcription factor [Candidatus Methylacidiphilales bacterium]|nr:metalloregulator ArsR/SmtB family transcription factor [Candidatus Methylacidiphilales bacterium]
MKSAGNKSARKTRLSHDLNGARAAVVKALAHPSRMLIADALVRGEKTVCELTGLVGSDISTVSKHLALMKDAGLVVSDKRGLNSFYRLTCPCLGDFFCCIDSMARSRARKLTAALEA